MLLPGGADAYPAYDFLPLPVGEGRGEGIRAQQGLTSAHLTPRITH